MKYNFNDFNNQYKQNERLKAEMNKNIMTVFSIVIIIVIIIILISPKQNDQDESEPIAESENKAIASTETETQPEQTEFQWLEITSTELISTFKDNQVRCKKLYDGEFLAVTGRVDSIGTDILDQTYVCLGSDEDYTFVGIQCYTKYDYVIDQIAELHEGDIITVYGIGECGSLTFDISRIDHIDLPE